MYGGPGGRVWVWLCVYGLCCMHIGTALDVMRVFTERVVLVLYVLCCMIKLMSTVIYQMDISKWPAKKRTSSKKILLVPSIMLCLIA